MKKPDMIDDDEGRPEYKRSDFGPMVRGKYAARMKLAHLVALDPDLAEAFPTDRAVNDALRLILASRKSSDLPG